MVSSQVGWVVGPQRVIREIQIILPYMQFCVSTPFQEAVCNVLVEAERPYKEYPNYYEWLRQQYLGKRERLERALTAAGIKPLKGQGGFFLIGDVNGIKVGVSYKLEGVGRQGICRYTCHRHVMRPLCLVELLILWGWRSLDLRVVMLSTAAAV